MRRLAVAAAAAGVVASLAALAWHDVLPGGWTLRRLVLAPFGLDEGAREEERRARARHARLAEFAREPEPPPGAIVFLGSSTIERFPLAREFPGVPTVDRGIGDEPVAGLLARLAESLPNSAGGAVLYAGSVDLRRLGRSAGDTASDVRALVAALRELSPGLPIAILGVLPDRVMEPAVAERVRLTNELLAGAAAELGVSFVATHRPPLCDASGRLDAEHSTDDLHLSERGYDVLARWLVEDGGEVGRRLAR